MLFRSNISMAFEEAVNPYTNSPEYFLTTPFKQLALSDFSTAYLSVEVSQNGIVRFTTFSDEIQDLSWIEQLLYKNLSQEYIGVQYSLKHHHYDLNEGGSIDVKLKIDSTRLEIAYQVFERVFFFIYGAFNLILLSLLLSWISNPIKRAIKRLTFTTNEIRKGNMDAELFYEDQDDFQELAHSIESMRQALQMSVKKQRILEIEKKELLANISQIGRASCRERV